MVARVLTALAAVLLAAWGCGQYWTDEHHATQYLWWMPTHWVIGVCWVLVVVSWALERLSLRLGGFQLRSLMTLVLLVLSGWMLVGAWHIHRAVMPQKAGDLRVLYWNMTVGRELNGAVELVLAQEPDVAIIANPRLDGLRGQLLAGLGTLGSEPDPEASERPDSLVVGPTRFLFRHEIAVATRGQIVRWGSVTFQMRGVDDESHRGVVMFVEITGLSDNPVVVWIVDLPSHASLWRQEVAAEAARAVMEWRGPEFRLTSLGQWEPATGADGFPEPGVIVGDFNIPRASASLRTLVGKSAESHASRGWGPATTWNRTWPGWSIDLLFAGAGWTVTRHRVVDPRMGMHRMIVVDLKAE